MNADETEIYEFLKTFQNLFVSVTEVSKRISSRKRYEQDRTWARPILRRMELDGILESNPFGEYRIKPTGHETTSFKKALLLPNVPLGDTAIIMLEDVGEADSAPPDANGGSGSGSENLIIACNDSTLKALSMDEIGLIERATNPFNSATVILFTILTGAVLMAVAAGMALNIHLKKKDPKRFKLKRRRLNSV